jgi:hypothetical protein
MGDDTERSVSIRFCEEARCAEASLDLKGDVTSAIVAHPPQLLVGYFGKSLARLGGTFLGTLIAPRAEITLLATSRPHRGVFFANEVELNSGASVIYTPLAN